MRALDFVRRFAVHQPNAYYCGPCAIRHALLHHGHRVRVSRIAKLANTTSIGTWSWDMARALEALDFSFGQTVASAVAACGQMIDPRESFTDYRLARDALREYLDEATPVIVLVDASDHWITAHHATSKRITVSDSSFYNQTTPVVHELTWTKLLSRMCKWTPGRTRFDLYPVRPR